jgi:hypothetical protein
MTSALIAAGCEGQDTHAQHFDGHFPTGKQIVWRRSFPHAGGWPRAKQIVSRLESENYVVKALVMTRDWHCMSNSQVAHQHASTVNNAMSSIREAYHRIFGVLNETKVEYVMVSYESLVFSGLDAVNEVLAIFGLSASGIAIENGNLKHFYQGLGHEPTACATAVDCAEA